jgi:hypothetical protein
VRGSTLERSWRRERLQPRGKAGGRRRLMGPGLNAGGREAGAWTSPAPGTPPGGVLTPPTKWPTFFFGIRISKGRSAPQYKMNLLLRHFHPLAQRTDQVPVTCSVGCRQAMGDVSGTVCQTAQHPRPCRGRGGLIRAGVAWSAGFRRSPTQAPNKETILLQQRVLRLCLRPSSCPWPRRLGRRRHTSPKPPPRTPGAEQPSKSFAPRQPLATWPQGSGTSLQHWRWSPEVDGSGRPRSIASTAHSSYWTTPRCMRRPPKPVCSRRCAWPGSEAVLAHWRERLLEALGPNDQGLIDMLLEDAMAERTNFFYTAGA